MANEYLTEPLFSANLLPSHVWGKVEDSEFLDTVRLGYEIMANSSVCFTGLARNLGKTLDRTMSLIQAAGELFDAYTVCIYENDSNDGTDEKLKAWEKNNPNVYVRCDTIGKKHWGPVRDLRRMMDLAAYRNRCRDMVFEHCPEVQFVVVVDTDLAGGWSLTGLAHSLGKSMLWDFCAATSWALVNNKWVHYDAWAFRRGDWKPMHASQVNPYLPVPGDRLTQVKSAFGGLGIYSTAAYESSKYDGLDCEHVCLHRGMAEKGYDGIFLNPAQITIY